MDRPIIFNHIPRTGGTTLRVILNKVYGKSRVFFINSKDIGASLATFSAFNSKERDGYRVISGHSALQFRELLNDAFTISILRDPVDLFRSQYYYLRKSPDSNFLDEVRSLSSFEDYMEYALEKGQDNMMVRCLDPENKQFIQATSPPPDMERDGKAMLQRAMAELENHDAVFSLSTFDTGVFQLSGLLSWPRIPLYRPLNRASYIKGSQYISPDLSERLGHILRFDIELYEKFIKDIAEYNLLHNKKGVKYNAFKARQRLIRMLF
jgi:hypothetical protein